MGRCQISQVRALVSAIAIFFYFGVVGAWVPSALLNSSLLATAPRGVADGITVVVWGGLFGAGVVALRWAQNRELI